jgi:putative ABC transport system permease protein
VENISGLTLLTSLPDVTQRTAEIGVRIALGAPRTSVRWMVLKEAFIFLAAGIVLGGALLYATVRFIQGMLYRISAFDLLTLAGVMALLAVVAFVAAFVPALHASRVDLTRPESKRLPAQVQASGAWAG